MCSHTISKMKICRTISRLQADRGNQKTTFTGSVLVNLSLYPNLSCGPRREDPHCWDNFHFLRIADGEEVARYEYYSHTVGIIHYTVVYVYLL